MVSIIYFYDHQVDSSNRYASDAVQFSRANKELLDKYHNYLAFRKDILKRHPEFAEWVKNGNKSASPKGFIWHHHEDTNRLVLVEAKDHKSNHKLYHPTGKGGRDI